MNCKNCSKELSPSPTRKKVGDKKYCDNKCQQEYQIKKRFDDFRNGKYVGRLLQFRTGEWTRRLLIEESGYACNSCSISDWNGKTIVLEVNHKDGNASNNTLDNIEFLCPNCHSQTDTFRSKNKNGARVNRK